MSSRLSTDAEDDQPDRGAPRVWLRNVRFRLRVASGDTLSPTLLGAAGAIALGSGTAPDEAWHRALGTHRLDAARAAFAGLSTDDWDGSGEDELSPTRAAAALAAAPADDDAHARPLTALTVVEYDAGLELGARIAFRATREGELKPLGLPWAGREAHTFIVGASGTGKSTLLTHLIADDLESGRALVLLDPHRDLSEATLALVPEERRSDVILIDPTDPETFPIDVIPRGRDWDPNDLSSRLEGAFEELFDPRGTTHFLGPYFFRLLRIILCALHDTSALTRDLSLADIEAVFVDPLLRQRVIDGLESGSVRDGLAAEHRGQLRPEHANSSAGWAASKFSSLVHGQAANVLARPAGYDLGERLSDGAIVIASLSVGELGTRPAKLMGRLLLSRLLVALASRARIGAGERREVSVVIDEAQHLSDGTILEQLLAQTRKFGGAVTLANQNPAQLGQGLPTVLTNCATVAAFRLPRFEAATVADRLNEVALALPRLPRYRFAITSTDLPGLGEPAIVRGAPPRVVQPTNADAARAASRKACSALSGAEGESPAPDLSPEGRLEALRERARSHLTEVGLTFTEQPDGWLVVQHKGATVMVVCRMRQDGAPYVALESTLISRFKPNEELVRNVEAASGTATFATLEMFGYEDSDEVGVHLRYNLWGDDLQPQSLRQAVVEMLTLGPGIRAKLNNHFDSAEAARWRRAVRDRNL